MMCNARMNFPYYVLHPHPTALLDILDIVSEVIKETSGFMVVRRVKAPYSYSHYNFF